MLCSGNDICNILQTFSLFWFFLSELFKLFFCRRFRSKRQNAVFYMFISRVIWRIGMEKRLFWLYTMLAPTVSCYLLIICYKTIFFPIFKETLRVDLRPEVLLIWYQPQLAPRSIEQSLITIWTPIQLQQAHDVGRCLWIRSQNC